ncbi:hypothetical protein Tco_0847780, partial [Tanacetum coccineum]
VENDFQMGQKVDAHLGSDVRLVTDIEFGFVVMGHEFDNYPKKMIHDIRSRDWFLEEHKEDSDEDDEDELELDQFLLPIGVPEVFYSTIGSSW